VLERLTKLRDFDSTQNLSPKELVEQGLCDAFKIFVKGDPHKLSKLVEGRLRLIFSESLIDNTIARLLCSLQNNTEITLWDSISSKPGMGLDDSGLRRLTQNVLDLALDGEIANSDVKGWDWSVQEWELLNDLERRIELNNSRGTVWERVARAHYYCMARKVMVLSDGTMYQQTIPGVIPSGWYNTSSTNSFMRALDHSMVAHMAGQAERANCVVMGDDCVERYFDHAQEYYKKLGKTVDMYEKVSETEFEFCSTFFRHGLGYPVNVDRQLINILCSNPVDYAQCCLLFNQYTYEMRHHPDIDVFTNILYESGWWKEM